MQLPLRTLSVAMRPRLLYHNVLCHCAATRVIATTALRLRYFVVCDSAVPATGQGVLYVDLDCYLDVSTSTATSTSLPRRLPLPRHATCTSTSIMLLPGRLPRRLRLPRSASSQQPAASSQKQQPLEAAVVHPRDDAQEASSTSSTSASSCSQRRSTSTWRLQQHESAGLQLQPEEQH